MSATVLIVEDEQDTLDSLSEFLTLRDFAPWGAASLKEAHAAMEAEDVDAVLLDLKLPDGNGLDSIERLREQAPHIALIVITGSGDVTTAVEAMRRGADHFLIKPLDPNDLCVVLEKSLREQRLRKRDQARRRLAGGEEIFFGRSPMARQVWNLAETAAKNDSVVLIQGETGTGKGVLARWIHEHSDRAGESFVELNCSSLRGELLASELFGHRKGAFTSAVEDREGMLEVADGGTLFLDEIGDMDVAVQAQLLKVLEEKRFRRIGETKARKSDFRLICATNRDLQAAVREKNFREDLYYRVCVFPIEMPPLREIRNDIGDLARHILERLGYDGDRLDEAMRQAFEAYDWPGNIREMRNVLERACLLAADGPLTAAHVPGLGAGGEEQAAAPTEAAAENPWALEANEAVHIRNALDHFAGDPSRTSEALGVSRATFYRKLKKYGIPTPTKVPS